MNILVSGANGNLGTSVVDTLATAGHKIIGIYSSKEQLKVDDRSIAKYAVDLMDAEATKKTLKDIGSKHGHIRAAVLTVGGFAMGELKDTSSQDIHEQIKLNFDTAYHLVQPLMEQMPKGSQLFLIGAKPALNTSELKGKLAYGFAKSLLFTLAEVINSDTPKHGINCSVIVPSIIDTKPNRESMPDADFSDWVKPEEIANSIRFYLENPFLKQGIIKAFGNV